MFYLITQIAVIVAIAVVAGLMIGWWTRGKLPGGASGILSVKTLQNDPFDARFRLEQCHRDNSALRRELKEAESKVEKFQARIDNADNSDSDMLERLETAEIRSHALLEDLQLRDDTIAALERELESLRRNA